MGAMSPNTESTRESERSASGIVEVVVVDVVVVDVVVVDVVVVVVVSGAAVVAGAALVGATEDVGANDDVGATSAVPSTLAVSVASPDDVTVSAWLLKSQPSAPSKASEQIRPR